MTDTQRRALPGSSLVESFLALVAIADDQQGEFRPIVGALDPRSASQ
jgi:hypothetical protein